MPNIEPTDPDFDLESEVGDDGSVNLESPKLKLVEEWVLQKYDGDPLPENLVETVYLTNGKVTKTVKRGEE